MKEFSRLSELDPDDYYRHDDGYIIYTEKYHLKRGYCCENRCKHCPYGNSPQDGKSNGAHRQTGQ